MKVEKLEGPRWRIEPEGGMRVPGLVFADERMMRELAGDPCLEQVCNVAHLPGIAGASLAMPDIHWGYGFPIGGVAAMDAQEGVVSPGGVGYDINCGVRLVTTALDAAELGERRRDVLLQLFRDVPAGVGAGHGVRLSRAEMTRVLERGAAFSVERGGRRDDLERTEAGGCLAEAEPDAVSERARERGGDELGSLGSGNHFLELQEVAEIFDEPAAEAFGLRPGQLALMIHCGSRGLGHQVCDDFLATMGAAMAKYRLSVPDRQLACVPARSPEGARYLGAMAAAANFAWANRQAIQQAAEGALRRVLALSERDLGARLLYDVCHNIAKRERHEVDGRPRDLLVHRKGATRAFGPGREEVPAAWRATGQPVIVPGDMGRASYVLVGTERAMQETFGSSCHGAGRRLGRHEALRRAKGRDIPRELAAVGVEVVSRARKTLAEEMPEAYKDVADVVAVLQEAGITRKVARMRPIGVVKG